MRSGEQAAASGNHLIGKKDFRGPSSGAQEQ
jgi:hypothetical protein